MPRLPSNSREQREELKKFLRARRASLPLDSQGAWPVDRRRTPGLRREEVAGRAGMSVSWYTWLEQGRPIQCSIDLFARLAVALDLSESDTDYLFRLGGFPAPVTRAGSLGPELQMVLDRYRGPAFILGPRLDALAFNASADELFSFDGHPGPFGRNHVWRGFLDAGRRAIYCDWETTMMRAVGALRANYGVRLNDPGFKALVAELSARSPDFVRMWELHQTEPVEGAVWLRLRGRAAEERLFVSARFELPAVKDHSAMFLWPSDA